MIWWASGLTMIINQDHVVTVHCTSEVCISQIFFFCPFFVTVCNSAYYLFPKKLQISLFSFCCFHYQSSYTFYHSSPSVSVTSIYPVFLVVFYPQHTAYLNRNHVLVKLPGKWVSKKTITNTLAHWATGYILSKYLLLLLFYSF